MRLPLDIYPCITKEGIFDFSGNALFYIYWAEYNTFGSAYNTLHININSKETTPSRDKLLLLIHYFHETTTRPGGYKMADLAFSLDGKEFHLPKKYGQRYNCLPRFYDPRKKDQDSIFSDPRTLSVSRVNIDCFKICVDSVDRCFIKHFSECGFKLNTW